MQRHIPIWIIILVTSVGPLGLALLSQYGFGLHPCELCIWQRIPYALLILLGCAAWWWRHALKITHAIAAMAVALWVVEAGLAAYHVGVEQGWWASASGCSAAPVTGQSLDDLRAAILNAPVVACDQPEFIFLGLSMAGWNLLFALVMAGFMLGKMKRWKGAQHASR